MSANDSSSYRPKSPDLSSFFSGSTEPFTAAASFPAEPTVPPNAPPQHNSSHHHQPHHHQPHQHRDQSYSHHSPQFLNHQPSHDPYLQHQLAPPNQHPHYPANPQPYEYPPTTQPTDYGYGSSSFTGASYAQTTSPHGIKTEDPHPYHSPGQGPVPTSQPGAFPHHSAPQDPYAHQQHQPPFPQPYVEPTFPQFAGSGTYTRPYHSSAGGDQAIKSEMPQNAMPFDSAPVAEQASAPRPPPVNLPDPSPVKTKFPTARIKRIMQADEEVGKVAQQTPIAVGKALEMFMVQLVLTSADVAREKGSKRVTAQMLKQVVETDEQWDFLRDIVSKVETHEKGGKGGNVKAESDSDEEEPKKKKGGRKKKTG